MKYLLFLLTVFPFLNSLAQIHEVNNPAFSSTYELNVVSNNKLKNILILSNHILSYTNHERKIIKYLSNKNVQFYSKDDLFKESKVTFTQQIKEQIDGVLIFVITDNEVELSQNLYDIVKYCEEKRLNSDTKYKKLYLYTYLFYNDKLILKGVGVLKLRGIAVKPKWLDEEYYEPITIYTKKELKKLELID